MKQTASHPWDIRWRTGHLSWLTVPDEEKGKPSPVHFVTTNYYELEAHKSEDGAWLYSIVQVSWRNKQCERQPYMDEFCNVQLTDLRTAWRHIDCFEVALVEAALQDPQLSFSRDYAMNDGIHYTYAYPFAMASPLAIRVDETIASRLHKMHTVVAATNQNDALPICPPPTRRICHQPASGVAEIQWHEARPWLSDSTKFDIMDARLVAPRTWAEELKYDPTGAIGLSFEDADKRLRLADAAIERRIRNQNRCDYFYESERYPEPEGMGTAEHILRMTDLKDPAYLRKSVHPK